MLTQSNFSHDRKSNGLRRPPVDKALSPTPNTRAQFSLGGANVNESLARQNISGDGPNSTFVAEPQVIAEKNVGNVSKNDATARNSAIENKKRDDDSDLLSNRNYFGSMVSINEDFNTPDANATLKRAD